MAVHDLYQSSTSSYNSSLRGAREALDPAQAYYEPEALMTGQVWVNSGRQPWSLPPRSVAPPRIVAPTPAERDANAALDAQMVVERMAHRVGHLASLESIYVKTQPWGFECWLISNRSTENERFRLYDLEWQLMELVPDVGFKFHLVDRQGRPLTQVLTLEPFDAVIVLRKIQDA
jgi:hypothetical protein